MTAIGVDETEAWRVLVKVALDCMPKLRRSVIEILRSQEKPAETSTVATETGYPTKTVHRALEDLTAHGVVSRHPQGPGRADLWDLSTWSIKMINGAEIKF